MKKMPICRAFILGKNMREFKLKKQDVIQGYKIEFCLESNSIYERYRVLDKSGNNYFLHKLNQTYQSSFEKLLTINHPNLLKTKNYFKFNNSDFIISEFISGEIVKRKVERENGLFVLEANHILLSICNGVNHLHQKGILFKNLNAENVFLDLKTKQPIPKLFFLNCISNDYICSENNINIGYVATEVIKGEDYSVQSDIFSIGVLYFYLLTGKLPFSEQVSQYKSTSGLFLDEIYKLREIKIDYPDTIDEKSKAIIQKTIHFDPKQRYKSVSELVEDLICERIYSEPNLKKIKPKEVEQNKPSGFKAISGMQNLKQMLTIDIINALKEPEKYQKYGLAIPNGMLLYGPPGCGKTFFAEKFAEEINFKFYQLKPSDIQSKWVNATQEKVKNLFDEAKRNSPSIIFIDELDAIVPSRDTDNISHMNTAAVNEFLAQMNNCGEYGIFVIGATNRPNAIDPAILRSGRLDKHIYLPPPDFEAREMMFEYYLKSRPISLDINYSELAKKTECYASSDIKFLCDESARKALYKNEEISQNTILEIIKVTKSSLTKEMLNEYKKIDDKINGKEQNEKKQKIGFI